jgi:hypothetical protein
VKYKQKFPYRKHSEANYVKHLSGISLFNDSPSFNPQLNLQFTNKMRTFYQDRYTNDIERGQSHTSSTKASAGHGVAPHA